MNIPPAIVRDARRTLYIALPLMGAQVLQLGNGVVDALVAGRLGRAELAAGGMGAGLWFFVSMACIGLMAGLSPTLANLIGASRRVAVGAQFRQGLWFAAIVGALALVAIRLCMATLNQWGFDPEIPPLMIEYLSTAGWSLPAFAMMMACRNLYEATGISAPVLIMQVIGLIVNTVCSFGLGLGLWCLPKLGLLGIGLSTSIVAVVMAVLMFVWLRAKRFQRYQLFQVFEWPKPAVLGSMLVLALPIYFGMVFEGGIFFFTNLQMATIGTLESAAHNVAIGIAAMCYMLPLGLSLALTARVGKAYGRGSRGLAIRRVVSGLLVTALLAMTTITALIVSRHWVGTLYTDDVDVLALIATLLIFAAVFQLSDGVQVVLIGMLRGLQDTRVPMLINAFSYWVIAAPVGYYLAHNTRIGAPGLWLGLIIGLSIASLLLAWRLKKQLTIKFCEPSEK